ncbi:hypothetical protein EYR40_001303 [Pleurotus pulmonarius]|nr:hypothetical protein EYR38_004542 [Pleurotus pulmonarius]KAF4608950.1 hypothetical protein EYR40_001303 [Pleurotus pulmonarius]
MSTPPKCFRDYTAPNQRISPIPWHVQPYELIPHIVLQRDHVDGAYRVYLVAFEPEQKITAGVAAMYTGGHAFHVAYDVLRVNNARDLSLDARDPRFHRLEKYFKKRLIIVNLPRTNAVKKIVYGLVPHAGRFRFVDGKQNVTTVADYFARENKPVSIPCGFCEVVKGQFYRGKVPEENSRGVQDFATARPTDRLRAIETGFLHKARLPSPVRRYQPPRLLISKYTYQVGQYKHPDLIQDPEMMIEPSPLGISGRILNAPGLQYGGGHLQHPVKGAWNVKEKQLHTPKKLIVLGVVNLGSEIPSHVVEDFARDLQVCCNRPGMGVSDWAYFQDDGNPQATKQAWVSSFSSVLLLMVKEMHTFMGQRNLDPTRVHIIVLVIIPQNAADV